MTSIKKIDNYVGYQGIRYHGWYPTPWVLDWISLLVISTGCHFLIFRMIFGADIQKTQIPNTSWDSLFYTFSHLWKCTESQNTLPTHFCFHASILIASLKLWSQQTRCLKVLISKAIKKWNHISHLDGLWKKLWSFKALGHYFMIKLKMFNAKTFATLMQTWQQLTKCIPRRRMVTIPKSKPWIVVSLWECITCDMYKKWLCLWFAK